jgi:cell wall-associated NlpC family hydrolase
MHCSGTSPRFSSPQQSSSRTKENTHPRFATPIEEEMRKDDKKVDIENVKKNYRSRRFSTDIAQPKQEGKLSENKESLHTTKSSPRDKAMEEILSLLGTPYVWGGKDEDGIDCSAFTQRIFHNAFLVSLPRTTKEQIREGKTVPTSSLLFGDLLFFNTTGESPSHVGIFLDDELFAHASQSFGVTISSLESTYYKEKYIGARRILKN